MFVCLSGDGSFMRVVFDLCNLYGIDVNSFPCCILPFGTGNDLSNSLGWGYHPRQAHLVSLQAMLSEILSNTHEQRLNIWEVDAYWRKGGGVALVDNGELRSVSHYKQEKYSMLMVNYASIGDESRSGIQAELKRKDRWCCAMDFHVAAETAKLHFCGVQAKASEYFRYIAT